MRCRVWTWFRGSAAVGVQKDLSPLATFPCRTADLGGSLAPNPSVQEGLPAPWLFRRLVGTKLRRGSKSGELQGGLVVQNLPDPLAWPERHPSWRGEGFCSHLLAAGFSLCSSDSPVVSFPPGLAGARSAERLPMRPGWRAPRGAGSGGRPAGLCAACSRVCARSRASKLTPYVFLLDASRSNSRRIIIATRRERQPSPGKGHND